MTLATGSKLGPYEIVAVVGAGEARSAPAKGRTFTREAHAIGSSEDGGLCDLCFKGHLRPGVGLQEGTIAG